MVIHILLLCLAIPNYLFGMLKQGDMQKFVKSHSLVDKIPHRGNFTHSLLPIPNENQLIATIDKGLISFNCKTHEPTPIPTKTGVANLTFNPDKNVFYGTGTSTSLVVGHPQNYTCEVLNYSLLHGKLVYNSTNKQLYSGQLNRITVLNHDGTTNLWNALSSDNVAYVSKICCNETENALYIGSTKGDIEKRSTSGKFIKSINVCKDQPIWQMICDQNSGSLFVDTGKNGVIQQCDANLENLREIRYAGLSACTQTLTQDPISKLLCITSITNDRERLINIHFLHPNNRTARLTKPLPLCWVPQTTACDPITGTFFVGTGENILIFKPEKPYLYLSLLNKSVFTVFKTYKKICLGS